MVYDKQENDVYLWRNNSWSKAKFGEGNIPQSISSVQFVSNEIRINEAGNLHTQSLNSMLVSGDVSGNVNATNVGKLQGNAINPVKLSSADNGKAMVWNGVHWTAQPLADNSVTNETISSTQLANNELRIIEAGNTKVQSLDGLQVVGDVNGTINNAVVTKIQGNPVNNTKLLAADNGKVLVWNGAQWTAQPVADNSITNETISSTQLANNELRIIEAGNTKVQSLDGLQVVGDVTGTINNAVVTKIQGNPVNNTKLLAADNGKNLIWNGAQWTARPVADNSITNETISSTQLANNELRIIEAGNTKVQSLDGLQVVGDVNGTINNAVVTKIQGNPVNNTKLLAADNGRSSRMEWRAMGRARDPQYQSFNAVCDNRPICIFNIERTRKSRQR